MTSLKISGVCIFPNFTKFVEILATFFIFVLSSSWLERNVAMVKYRVQSNAVLWNKNCHTDSHENLCEVIQPVTRTKKNGEEKENFSE